MKKNQSEEERSKSGGTPAASVDGLMSIASAHALGDKSSVGGVLVHMPHVSTAPYLLLRCYRLIWREPIF